MRGGIVWTVFPFLGVLCVGLARQVEPVAARVAFGDSNTTIITALLRTACWTWERLGSGKTSWTSEPPAIEVVRR